MTWNWKRGRELLWKEEERGGGREREGERERERERETHTASWCGGCMWLM
jgi:hypothetical protein